MKKIYYDRTAETSCTSLFMRNVEIINAGTTIYSMPAGIREKEPEYQDLADNFDVHFIFDDNIPQIDFYAVPQVDIMATDGDGGYIGTIGQICDLESDAPVCYIDKNRVCYFAARSGREFLDHISDWKDHLQPCPEVSLYNSREEAACTLEFINIRDFDGFEEKKR